MILVPKVPFIGRHKRARVAPPSPPVGPLQLVSATITFDGGSDAVVALVFDNSADDPFVDLESAVGTNWTATISGHSFGGNNPLELAAYNTIQLSMGNTGDAEGANAVSYLASPPDLVTASGRTLAAFNDLPLS